MFCCEVIQFVYNIFLLAFLFALRQKMLQLCNLCTMDKETVCFTVFSKGACNCQDIPESRLHSSKYIGLTVFPSPFSTPGVTGEALLLETRGPPKAPDGTTFLCDMYHSVFFYILFLHTCIQEFSRMKVSEEI